MPASYSNRPLTIRSGIQPVELCRLGVTLSLNYCGSLDPDHILYSFLRWYSNACKERLRSRHPFVPVARNLLNNLAGFGIRGSKWISHQFVHAKMGSRSFTKLRLRRH